MTQTILVTTPLKVTFRIRREPTGIHVGQLAEYPGIITQGRSRDSVRRKLIRLLRETDREHPEEIPLFR